MSGNGTRPSTPAIELGKQLKAERERSRSGRARGYNKREIPVDITSARTLLEVEEGRKKRVNGGLVRELCAFYDTDPELVENLVLLAKATLADEWTDTYASAIDNKGWLYQQREDRATSLRFHDSLAVPSMLHTKSYVEMIERTTKVAEMPDIDWAEDLRYRMDRKERWLQSRRPATFVIGQAALSVNIGDEAKQDLRAELSKIAQLPFAEVRVVPFTAGRYDLMGWEVSILDFDDGQEPMIRTQSARGSGFVSPNSRKGKVMLQTFDEAEKLSVPVKEFLS